MTTIVKQKPTRPGSELSMLAPQLIDKPQDGLQSQSSGTYLTQAEVAELLRLSPRTLERHRLNGTGPAYVKLGRKVVYRRAAVEGWAAANTFTSTSGVQGRSTV